MIIKETLFLFGGVFLHNTVITFHTFLLNLSLVKIDAILYVHRLIPYLTDLTSDTHSTSSIELWDSIVFQHLNYVKLYIRKSLEK